MVWVKMSEKHRGVNKGVFWKKYPSIAKARSDAKAWNSFTSSDKIRVLGSSKVVPKGARKI